MTAVTFNHDRVNRIAIFLIALLCYGYFFPRWADNNQNSRLNMVVAVVDDGTFQIDRYVHGQLGFGKTVDYAKVGDHYYSDKAPGVAFLGIPIYAGLRLTLDWPVMDRLTERLANSEAFKATLRESGSGVVEDKVRYALAQVALSFLTNAIPSALLCVLLYQLARGFGARPSTSAFVALAYGLLTPAFAYANAFYGHQLSAAMLVAAFYLIFSLGKPDAPRPSAPRALAIGLLLGYSVVTEFPAALVAGILALYAIYMFLRRAASGGLVWVFIGLSVCAAALMIYNNAVFGGPFKLGYSSSELWQQQHSAGLMSLTLPHWEAAFGITFSPFRGLFVLSPIMLLALPGFVLWWRSGEARAACLVSLFSVLAMFLFNASSIMWWGGFAVGPRYLLPGLPFMALALIFVVDPAARRDLKARPAWLTLLIVFLSAWSLVATWGLTLAEQAFPPDTIFNPLVEYALPNWLAGNVARNVGTVVGFKGYSSLLPLVATCAVVTLVWWMASRLAAAERPVVRTVNPAGATRMV
ncbi:MAG: hypothetical protein ACFLMY_14625 [Candidatus Brachytrichaceae bacterium NZ_4S206]|jgi:hypothetical protein